MACLGLHSNADDSLKRLCCLVWYWFVVIIFTHNYIIHFHHCNRVTSIIISKFVKTCILGQPVKICPPCFPAMSAEAWPEGTAKEK